MTTDSADSRRGLEALLDSRSIAVVGASDRPGSPGSRVMHVLRESGYDGEVLAVNPRLPVFVGASCAASLEECRPGPIDHVLVLTPASTVPDVLRECVRREVGAVTLLPAGFEHDEHGRGPAEQFAAIVGDSGVRILGPNCLGVVNAHSGLVASPASAFMGGAVHPGPVSIISQSGAVGAYLMGLLAEVGLGIRYCVSTGNEVDIKLGEAVMHCATDPVTQAVVVYLEGLRDTGTFVAALTEARSRGKSVIVLKAGETDVGAAAVQSHTAALAGDDAVYDAAFERLGAHRVRSLSDAVCAVRAALPPARTDHRIQRTAVMTTSGGLGILAAEALVRQGFELPDVPSPSKQRMLEVLPFCTPANPIDLGGTVPAQPAAFLELLHLAVADLALDALVVVVSNMPHSPTAWTSIRDTLTAFVISTDVVVAVVGALTTDDERAFRGLGALTASDPAAAVSELAILDQVTAARATKGTLTPALPVPRSVAVEPLEDLAAMQVLLDVGVPFPDFAVLGMDRAAGAVGLDDVSLPSAIKLLQHGVLHKAAAGNVVTGVRAADERCSVIEALKDKAAGEGQILVQAMVDNVLAELLVSARRDATFGPVVVLGSGGRDVELLRDRVLLLDPFDADDVTAAVLSLATLDDLGEHAEKCLRQVADVVAALRGLLAERPDLVEIEINPVLLRSEAPFAVAVDAVVLAAATSPLTPSRSPLERAR